ncbi:MAG: alkaline phosphatase [Anaerolineaceae bacterium]|nr:alkaline phosphatase [Anaerolineaceae bacterium]
MITANWKRSIYALLAIVLVLTAFLSAQAPLTAQAADAAEAAAPAQSQHARYIFLFIGDGMGVAQRNSAELYLANTENVETGLWYETKLLMNTFPAQGMTTTYDAGSIITDSASAGTAIATGHKTLSGVISMSPDKTEKYTTIAEIAKQQGWKVGVVTSVSLDHATPAVFYAHNASRKNMYAIAGDMVRSGFDYFAGGGLVQPQGSDGKSADIYVIAQNSGYTIVDNAADFNALQPGDGKVLAMNGILDNEAAMYYEMDRAENDLSLADYTRKGIELLDNPEGFFMMVEGGKIDWACHANDATASIKDTLAFDAAIAEAYAFYQAHPDETAIIVTGDHETGGMSIGFAGTQYASFFTKLTQQPESYLEFNKALEAFKAEKGASARLEDAFPMIEEYFGMVALSESDLKAAQDAVAQGAAEGASEADKAAAAEADALLSMTLTNAEIDVLRAAFAESMKDSSQRSSDSVAYNLYGGYEPLTIKLTTILDQKAGIGWTTYAHTGTPVQTSAVGVGNETFNGFYDNTEIFTKMMDIAGF